MFILVSISNKFYVGENYMPVKTNCVSHSPFIVFACNAKSFLKGFLVVFLLFLLNVVLNKL